MPGRSSLREPSRRLDAERRPLEVDVDDPLPEAHRHPVQLGRVEQLRVEAGARDRVDGVPAVGAVRLERELAVRVVQHPPAHGQRLRQHGVREADPLEGVDAARRQREVDGAAVVGTRHARVGAALEHGHAQPAPGEEAGQQRAREPGTDDRDLGLVLAQRPAASSVASASAARQQSW